MRTAPALRIVEAQQQLEHRRLARARGSDQRDPLARAHVEREVGRAPARRDATDSGTSTSSKRTVPRAGAGSGTGCAGARIAGSIASSSNSRSVAPAARCRSPITSLIVPTALATMHRVEHERRQLAGADAAGDDVVAADPQDDADRAEHQQDHGRDEQRTLPDAAQRGARTRLRPASANRARSLGLVAVRLHRADLVQRLVDVRADVADAILARARELAHAAAEQDDRHAPPAARRRARAA